MKANIYILTTFVHYEQTDERAIWSISFPTRKSAEKALRKQIREDLEDYFEGSDVIENKRKEYPKLIRNAIKAGGEEHDAIINWIADRLYIYDIFPDVLAEIKEIA